jgi:uncharacterized protein (TIGR00251 family)
MHFSYNDKTKTATILLKVKAGAKRSCIDGFDDINGLQMLKISIKAAPQNGKANIAIIKMLSDIWGLKQNQLEIIKGIATSTKTLLIKDVTSDYIERL